MSEKIGITIVDLEQNIDPVVIVESITKAQLHRFVELMILRVWHGEDVDQLMLTMQHQLTDKSIFEIQEVGSETELWGSVISHAYEVIHEIFINQADKQNSVVIDKFDLNTLRAHDVVMVLYSIKGEDGYKSTHIHDNNLSDKGALKWLEENYGDIESIHHIAR